MATKKTPLGKRSGQGGKSAPKSSPKGAPASTNGKARPTAKKASARPKLSSSHGQAVRTSRTAAVGSGTAGAKAAKVVVSERLAPKAKRPRLSEASPSIASAASRETAILVATAALEKKAMGLEILDVAGRVDYADFLVLMTGRSDRQVAALAQGIEEDLKRNGKRVLSLEGLAAAQWVLMDLGDVVVHIFQDETRSVYDIEGLWADAKRLPPPGDHPESLS